MAIAIKVIKDDGDNLCVVIHISADFLDANVSTIANEDELLGVGVVFILAVIRVVVYLFVAKRGKGVFVLTCTHNIFLREGVDPPSSSFI